MAAKKDEKLDLRLPGAILDLGQAIQSAHGGMRARPGSAPVGEQMAAAEDRLLAMVRSSATARRLTGIRLANQEDSERRVRLRAFCLLAYRALCQPSGHSPSEIADVAAAAMDPALPPGEACLRARHVIGLMSVEDVLVGWGNDANGPCTMAVLAPRALEWVCGRSSLAYLTMPKMLADLRPEPTAAAERPQPEARPVPSVDELHAAIASQVIGLDEQVRSLSSSLVMHLARARMLKAGREPGTGNQAILLVSSSSCGKTWLMSKAAEAAGCPFASMSASAMTSEGYVGGKLDDLFKGLVMRARGETGAARFGIAFADEWDKKALRYGRDVTTLAVQQEILVPMAGAEFNISGKRGMERPVAFNSNGTFFAFAGTFDGLAEVIRKRTGGTCIGFSAGGRTRRQEHVIDAIRDYGYVREWVNRLTAVMFLPDPQLGSLEKAAAGGVLDSFNALLGELGAVLFPHQQAIARMAQYALESRTFYRGIKSAWWSIAEAAIASGEKGTVLVGNAEVEAAIARISSGSADGAGARVPPARDEPPDAQWGAGVGENGEAGGAGE
jgi:ATP-dependent protease Clp ATPase subunit